MDIIDAMEFANKTLAYMEDNDMDEEKMYQYLSLTYALLEEQHMICATCTRGACEGCSVLEGKHND